MPTGYSVKGIYTTFDASMKTLFALHGFLGKPSDWDFLKEKFHVKALNLYSPLLKNKNLKEAGVVINHLADGTPHPRILMGYSLGGRLAMHALITAPTFWDYAIFISSHPGLENEQEKNRRLQTDSLLAERFLKDPWEKLMADWNQQSVFNQKEKIERLEKDYSRGTLASILRNWSLGRQDNLKDKLEELQIPLFFIAGQNDAKYVKLAKSLHLKNPHAQIWLAPNASHRVPWETPQAFIDQIERFFQDRFASNSSNPKPIPEGGIK